MSRREQTTLAVFDRLRFTGRRTRRSLVLSADLACVAVAVPFATALRYDFRSSAIDASVVLMLTVVVVAAQAAAGAWFGIYRGRYNYGSFDEAEALVRCAGVLAIVGVVVERAAQHSDIPRTVPIIAAAFALILQCLPRYVWRVATDQLLRPPPSAGRAVVFGAGDGGRQLITSMLRTADSPYLPVAIVDDDPAKQSLHIRGVPVLGTSPRLAQVAHDVDADAVIIAIPSAGSDVVRRVSGIAADSHLSVRILPSVNEMFGPDISVGDVRPLAEADLLGRREIDTDVDAIASYLTDKRVLVTGAGGSIGSELCRQIYRFAPASLVMLDRDESALHATQLSILGRAMLDSRDVVVADIRDHERIAEIFDDHRPQVVFHAAALKHLPLLEMYPSEGVKTNVLGTMHVLAAALHADVERFVNVSTDKAADPCCVLGHTKRVTERLTAWAATQTDSTYLSVRFGNVLGSRGSVLTAFRSQIHEGGPVTVTHPDVTRYFMTVEEASQLVIQAGSTNESGDVLVLDMGDPVRIADVARRLVAESGRRIEIVFTGLRPGEKLHEDLFGSNEPQHHTDHPLINRAMVPPLRPVEAVTQLDTKQATEAVAERLAQLCLSVGVDNTPVESLRDR